MLLCKCSVYQTSNDTLHTHLEGVLRHAGEPVIGGASGDGADAELPDLISLTELGDAFGLYHTHQTCEVKSVFQINPPLYPLVNGNNVTSLIGECRFKPI